MIVHCLYDELTPVTKIKAHPKNRNAHPPEQIERLAKILKYQGWRYPVKVSKRSGFVTSGHGRIEAAKLNGWKTVPVNFQDYDSDEQEYADVQADNAVASWAELDLAGINSDIGEIGPDFDIDLLGIEDFVLEPADKLEPQTDEDSVPDSVEPRTKRGDIYKLGRHRLMCGDSTSIDAVEQLMGGVKAEVVFTDPPYGYKYESNHQSKHDMLLNDDTFLDFMPCAIAATADNAAIYVCGSHQTIHKWREMFDRHFTYKNLIVWKKNNWSMGDLTGAFAGQHELILFGHKGRVELRGGRDRDVWEFDRDPPEHHPTQKPVELVRKAIESVSDNGSAVLDLFGGSGTSMIAAEASGRMAFLMELDPKYCDVIVARWEAYTGKKAELLNG